MKTTSKEFLDGSFSRNLTNIKCVAICVIYLLEREHRAVTKFTKSIAVEVGSFHLFPTKKEKHGFCVGSESIGVGR